MLVYGANQYIMKQIIYIYWVSPIKKAEELSNTPLARLQTSSINEVNEMRAYIEAICENKNIPCVSGLNKDT